MSTRAALKAFFETGDVPTESQFADLIDSFLHLTEDTTDDITEGAANKFFSVADEAKLVGIEAGAQVNPTLISQAEAEAGVATTASLWSALRVAQAIAALGGGGGGGLPLSPTIITSAFIAGTDKIYPVDATGGSIQVTPPSSPSVGDKFGITDVRRSFLLNTVSVRFFTSGQRYCGDSTSSANITLAQKDALWIFEYTGATYGWVMVGGGGKIT